MQKQPSEIRYHAIALEPSLPIRCEEPFLQGDRPITFLHFHACLELGYCHGGNGIFVVGEKILPFQRGDVSFIGRNELHLAKSAPGTHSRWSWIYLDPAMLLARVGVDPRRSDTTPLSGPAFGNLLSAREFPALNRIVLEMLRELRGDAPAREEALRALTWQLMVEAGRLTPPSAPPVRRPEYERLLPALQWMADHYREAVHIGPLARSCGMSLSHFRRRFLHTVGVSPRAYWHALRLRMAASLLRETSRSVLEISQQVGFETLSGFNRLFLKSYGMSPRRWRTGKPGAFSQSAVLPT